jgi:hypothetical protein
MQLRIETQNLYACKSNMNRIYCDLNEYNLFLKIDIKFEHTILTQGMKTVQGSWYILQ